MKRYCIIVPVYNVYRYLNRCVESLIEAIKFDNINDKAEIILVDDGSTDMSPRLCDELKNKFSNIIRVIHKNNGGLASARNAGLEHANSEYVIFVDSDDWIEKDSLKEFSAIINKWHPDIIKYGYNRIEKNKSVYGEVPCLKEGNYSGDNVSNIVYPNLLGNGKLFDYSNNFILSACMSVYRTDIIIKNHMRFQSERVILNEDLLFNMEIFLNVENVFVLHRKLYNYDCREGSLTQRYKPQMYERKCALLDYYENLLNGVININSKTRYSQFVIQQMYDCAVMEVQWNNNKNIRHRELKKIFSDPRICEKIQKLNGISISLKAKIILFIIKIKSPELFYILYRLGHRLSR